jgi:hypothetical protein
MTREPVVISDYQNPGKPRVKVWGQTWPPTILPDLDKRREKEGKSASPVQGNFLTKDPAAKI